MREPGPLLSRALLPLTFPSSWVYAALVRARNGLYERGLCEVKQLPAPVVSVGNLTAGGSGKTPLVALIARHFLSKGWPVAVLSRGYRRRDSSPFFIVSDGHSVQADVAQAGDEPLELALEVERLAVAVGADRFRTGLELIRRLGSRVFILDDGFQHRRLFRNLNLICLDAGERPAAMRLLPAGRLREPLSSLERAGALIWTRWKPGLPEDRLASRVLRALPPEAPVFRAVSELGALIPLGGTAERLPASVLRELPIAVLAGIARPERLKEDLEAEGARLAWFCARGDHHFWEAREIERLLERALAAGARAVVTTSKDAVKIKPVPASPLPFYRVELRMRILERERFEALLDGLPAPGG